MSSDEICGFIATAQPTASSSNCSQPWRLPTASTCSDAELPKSASPPEVGTASSPKLVPFPTTMGTVASAGGGGVGLTDFFSTGVRLEAFPEFKVGGTGDRRPGETQPRGLGGPGEARPRFVGEPLGRPRGVRPGDCRCPNLPPGPRPGFRLAFAGLPLEGLTLRCAPVFGGGVTYGALKMSSTWEAARRGGERGDRRQLSRGLSVPPRGL
mmetsp:Transcript_58366/g.96762  ORF Transcript_58366/g.96762 Transcript_58366/m.96762 type:complete len:211 (+) Transcript_58366:2779-3411(+)